ncbi:MAG: glucokinase [Gammaproteobacteria bacterium]|nr:glucokinase [Gammaproteobacteria bacterium]
MAEPCLLIGDIGGTNARFALANTDNPGFTDQLTLKCTDFDSADQAIRHYLKETDAGSPDVICFAAAGPLVNRQIQLTNNHWLLSEKNLEDQFSLSGIKLLNDFEAIAYSIPFLCEEDCLRVGEARPAALDIPHYMLGILGPGTGLGSVGLRKYNDILIPIPGEASHSGFAPETARQIEILTMLRQRLERVSVERLISGSGIENIYWALGRLGGNSDEWHSAAEIFDLAQKNDRRAAETIDLFFEILGQVAGDQALALGAENGIFIAGGIVQRYPQLILNSRFREGFENKGRHRALMEKIPTQVILHRYSGLLGAAYYALKLWTR